MSRTNVYISQHAKISTKLNHLVVLTDDKSNQIYLDDIGSLVIETTRAAITAHAVAECMSRDINIIFCDSKGLPLGQIVPNYTHHNRVDNIHKQCAWKQSTKDELWKAIIEDKIAHQALLLKEKGREDWQKIAALMDSVSVGDVDNREAVSAHMYFPRLFSYEFTRSDDSHPINAMLNYGYAILLSETARQIYAAGYLTELGIHHNNDKNPFNLACDFMEPFRPFVDRVVYGLEVKELNPDIKKALIVMLEDEMPGMHGRLKNLVENYVRSCLKFLDGGGNVPRLGFADELEV